MHVSKILMTSETPLMITFVGFTGVHMYCSWHTGRARDCACGHHSGATTAILPGASCSHVTSKHDSCMITTQPRQSWCSLRDLLSLHTLIFTILISCTSSISFHPHISRFPLSCFSLYFCVHLCIPWAFVYQYCTISILINLGYIFPPIVNIFSSCHFTLLDDYMPSRSCATNVKSVLLWHYCTWMT